MSRCWRCRVELTLYWVSVASLYSITAMAGFLAGAFWILGKVPA